MRKIADITLLTLVVNMALLAHGVREVRGNDMDGFKDNFFSYMYGANGVQEKPTMDAQPNGYKHPDGTPCRAKSIETCPFYKRDKSDFEKEDVLGSPAPSYNRKVKELEELYKSGGLANIPMLANASFDSLKTAFDDFLRDLEDYEGKDMETKWHDTQKRRDEIYSANKDNEYATINSQTGEVKEDCSGFGVTFHTTLSDAEMTPAEYDAKVTELCSLGKTDTWNVGIFQNSGEISIDCKDGARALAMMLYWNQNSIYNYSSGYTIYNLTYDEAENPGLKRGTMRVSNA